MQTVADRIIKLLSKKRIVLLYGDLGAGKTQLVKIVGEKLGIKKNISSPTFLISKHYPIKGKFTLYHYDLYRLKNFSELVEIGFLDAISDINCIVFIEWPDKIKNVKKNLENFVSQKEIISIYLEHTDNPLIRKIKLSC